MDCDALGIAEGAALADGKGAGSTPSGTGVVWIWSGATLGSAAVGAYVMGAVDVDVGCTVGDEPF